MKEKKRIFALLAFLGAFGFFLFAYPDHLSVAGPPVVVALVLP